MMASMTGPQSHSIAHPSLPALGTPAPPIRDGDSTDGDAAIWALEPVVDGISCRHDRQRWSDVDERAGERIGCQCGPKPQMAFLIGEVSAMPCAINSHTAKRALGILPIALHHPFLHAVS